MLMFDGVEVDAHGVTDRGRVRRTNEDQFLIAALHKVVEVHGTSIPASYQRRFGSKARALLLLVADGVGGRPGGDEASSITLDAIVSYVTTSMRCFYKLDEQIPADLLEELAQVVRESHDRLRSEAEQTPDRTGMATTLTMAHVLWPRVYVVQIGDSRCYHMRGGQLLQAIGGDMEVQPVISRVQMEPGDTLLLCTDGLTKHVTDEELRGALLDTPRSEDTTRRLLDTALERGATDNVTVIVGRFR